MLFFPIFQECEHLFGQDPRKVAPLGEPASCERGGDVAQLFFTGEKVGGDTAVSDNP